MTLVGWLCLFWTYYVLKSETPFYVGGFTNSLELT